jgi:hypothetical protein
MFSYRNVTSTGCSARKPGGIHSIDVFSTLLILVIEMNQGKHTNLGLGILIGGLAMALFFRQPPDENDSLPELEQTKVLERDFSLDFDEEPILANEIDQFEALHPLEFGEPELSRSGARIRGIEAATTPEREQPIPEKFPKQSEKIGIRSIEANATIAESAPRSDDVRDGSGRASKPPAAGISVPAQTVNAKVPGTEGFTLPDNLFTESFLREDSEPCESQVDLKSKRKLTPNGEVTNPSASQAVERPSTESSRLVEQPDAPPARVIIPRRIRLDEPIASQLGMRKNSPPQKVAPRTIEVNSASAELLGHDARPSFSSGKKFPDDSPFGNAADREFFPSLEGLEPLSISDQTD